VYASLGLADTALTDEQLLDAIERHPILLNRPFVVTDKGVRLCRPFEKIRDVL
jgi:arsenate reductase